MLTKLRIKNFKQFDDVEIELGPVTVLVGPNNSGKTSALQAFALWYEGYLKQSQWFDIQIDFRKQIERDVDYSADPTINRYDLTAIPMSIADLLWRNLHVKNGSSAPIEITLESLQVQSDFETEEQHEHILSYPIIFRYVNEESIEVDSKSAVILIDDDFHMSRFAYLTSMAGLIANEPLLQRGAIAVRIGEGRTAEVLRNLCYTVYENTAETGYWDKLVQQMREQFGVILLPPQYIPGRGEIRMSYKDRNGVTFDLSSAGRGMLQVLLLLAYMYVNPGAVLLLDEPDAHLEVLRQRQIYQLLTTVAQGQGSQVIIATHSEIMLEEAVNREHPIIAFIGKPHRMIHAQNVLKALEDIPYDEYYLAVQKGWVLYLEGTTDLDILRAFAQRLKHPAQEALKLPFVYYLESNYPSDAEKHFTGLREAKPDLVGFALFDRIPAARLEGSEHLTKIAWRRREIENYLANPDGLRAYARFHHDEIGENTMDEVLQLYIAPIALSNLDDPFWHDTKMSDSLLARVFVEYAQRLTLPTVLRKGDFYRLIEFLPLNSISPEVTEKLDAIVAVASRAKPRED